MLKSDSKKIFFKKIAKMLNCKKMESNMVLFVLSGGIPIKDRCCLYWVNLNELAYVYYAGLHNTVIEFVCILGYTFRLKVKMFSIFLIGD